MKKTAIITGGARGIGFGCTRRLGREGYFVVACASSPVEKYADNLAKLTEEGIEWAYVQADIRKKEDREKLIETAVSRYGRLDVLVNCAGVAPLVRGDLLDLTEESYDRVTGINTKGTLFMTQAAAKQMIGQTAEEGIRGYIINIGSCSAAVSSTSRGEYCISKAGVSMITTLFADRLAPEGILVNEVRPGIIETELTAVVKPKYDALIEKGEFPIARWGQPEDVADAVWAFCNGSFKYTTGNFVDVDGGFHIRRL